MKQTFLLVLLCGLAACTRHENDEPHSIVDIFGIDQSVSVHEYRLPDTAYMRSVILTRLTHGSTYTIACGRVGNTSDVPLATASFPALPTVDASAAPSVRNSQRHAIDSLRHDRDIRIDSFLMTLQRKVFAHPLHDQQTDINSFIAKANVMLHESTFRGASRNVYLMSDCIQDSVGSTGDTLRSELLNAPGVTLYLVGCKRPDAFAAMHVEQFQSIDNLLLFLQQPHTN